MRSGRRALQEGPEDQLVGMRLWRQAHALGLRTCAGVEAASRPPTCKWQAAWGRAEADFFEREDGG